MNETTAATLKELEAIARIKCCNLSDYAIALAHLVGDCQRDKAAQICTDMNLALGIMAGAIAQLLPVLPVNDAPPTRERTTKV